MSQKPFPPLPARPIELPAHGSLSGEVHVLSKEPYRALKAALFANRPLLVRGEPGVGKTQLARAAARLLNRPLVHHVVDARTEARDLMWTFDAVSRLAEAQISGAIDNPAEKDEVRKLLALKNFVRPGPLWWSFCWRSAMQAAGTRTNADMRFPPTDAASPTDPAPQAAAADNHRCPWFVPDQWNPGDGCVLLIDEIDKAETDVPNGLLEALGSHSFLPIEWSAPIEMADNPPLVVITTNEERTLPDAFIRRCLVLHLALPDTKNDALRDYLIGVGRAHFLRQGNEQTSEAVLKKAAEIVVEDRIHARDVLKVTPLPGQAEYLDLVRAAVTFSTDRRVQDKALEAIRPFVSQKHLDKNL